MRKSICPVSCDYIIMTQFRVLVGGGTGFVGTRLNNVLQKSGYLVTNVSRMPGVNNTSWSSIESHGIPKKTKAVVNLAGQQFLDFSKRWTPGFRQNVRNSRINTTKTLATAINKAHDKPKVFVVLTGVGAYEPSACMEYTEASTVTGSDFFSKLTICWESAAYVDPPVRLVIIRSGVVLGREGGMIKNMILPFFFGLGGKIASGKQFLPWIHVDDLTRMIKFAIENDDVKGILNGVAPQVITNEEFTKAFASALRRPAIIPVPEFILNKALHPERAMILTQGQKVKPQRVLEYGFEYKYDTIDKACKEVGRLF